MASGRKTEETEDFWRSFQETASSLASSGYDVVSFDDNPGTATSLARLVVEGRKRATAGLLQQFGPDREPLPVIGGYVVLVDGQGRPQAIWRTKELRLGPLVSVDEAFAWDEGEDDRTRASWLATHRRVFEREASRGGFRLHDEIDTVFERFEVVWPQKIAR